MPNQYHELLIYVDDIVYAYTLTDNIGNVIKINYFANTFTTMTKE